MGWHVSLGGGAAAAAAPWMMQMDWRHASLPAQHLQVAPPVCLVYPCGLPPLMPSGFGCPAKGVGSHDMFSLKPAAAVPAAAVSAVPDAKPPGSLHHCLRAQQLRAQTPACTRSSAACCACGGHLGATQRSERSCWIRERRGACARSTDHSPPLMHSPASCAAAVLACKLDQHVHHRPAGWCCWSAWAPQAAGSLHSAGWQ
mmetsp:Transcript_1366/g.3268  ORF Transcript_1366/g.3268 Transcript_1366/m.3268 type:complete len:201 (+) Transcript_1366:72-674(+)